MDAANDNWIRIEGEDTESMDKVQLHSPTRDHVRDQPGRLAVDQAQTTLQEGVSALTKSKRNSMLMTRGWFLVRSKDYKY